MAKYLDDTGLAYLWLKLKEKFAGKQDKLTGTAGQVVGFDSSGLPVAQDAPKAKSVTVTGVLADETKQFITPTPALASQSAYYEAGIQCTGQAANSLTFTADTVPTADLTVYVVMQEVSA